MVCPASMRPLPIESAVQGGGFTRAQARSAGYSYASVRARVQAGEWAMVAPGVLARDANSLAERGTTFAAALEGKA